MAAAQQAVNQTAEGELYHDRVWWEVEARRCGTDWRSLRLTRQRWLLLLRGAPQSTCDALLYELRTYGLPRLQKRERRWV